MVLEGIRRVLMVLAAFGGPMEGIGGHWAMLEDVRGYWTILEDVGRVLRVLDEG